MGAYAGLALAVAGPALGRGLVLAVDLAQTPRSELSGAYWGLPVGTNAGSVGRLPFDALLRLAGVLGVVGAAQKLLLLSIVFLAGLGMHRLAPGRLPGRFFAGVLYAVNPFVYERLLAGQWFLLLGYALIPWAFGAFLAVGRERPSAMWRFALLAALTGFASAHMGALLAILCLATVVIDGGPGARRRLWLMLAGALAACASLLWLLPTPGISELWSNVGHAQLELYRTLPDARWGPVMTVIGLGGFWNDHSPAMTALAVWPLIALLLLALALRGAFLIRDRRRAAAVAICGVFGAIAALGVSSAVTRPVTIWLMDHFAFVRSFRETDKTVALLAFAYAYLGAPAVDEIACAPRRRPIAVAASALALCVPLVYGIRELGGDWGALRPVSFPRSWTEAETILARRARTARTLFLPFHGYLHLSFANSRVTYNPATSFFSTPILASRAVDQDPAHQDVRDPEQARVSALLEHPASVRTARCLAGIGVAYVLLAHEADWRQVRGIESSRGVRVLRRWPELTLLELRHPGALAMTAPGPRARTTDACTGELRPLASRLASPVRLHLLARVPPGRHLVLGLPDAYRWTRNGDDVVFSLWPSYRRIYLVAAAGWLAVLISGMAMLMARRRTRRRRASER